MVFFYWSEELLYNFRTMPAGLFHIRALVSENLPCLCRIACQSGRPYGAFLGAVVGQLLGGEAARVDGVVGLLPVALAVPEGAGVSDGDNLRVLDAKLRYYTHIADLDSLNDTEWAMMVKELEWVRKEEVKANKIY